VLAPCDRVRNDCPQQLDQASIRRPVSRVLSPVLPSQEGRTVRRPFLWDAPRGTPRATNPDGTRRRACPFGRPSLFGLAPGGACLAIPVARDAVRSYRTLSPLPRNPPENWRARGGLLSVALSLGSLRADVIRRLAFVEPGLSSSPPSLCRNGLPAVARPPDRAFVITPRDPLGDSARTCGSKVAFQQ
jgi:hypothetical protein